MKSISIDGKTELAVNTLFCIGRNYAKHAEELDNEVPSKPMVFLKPNSSIIFDGDIISLPSLSKEVHHEVELVAAIGKEGKNIAENNALDYVAGYGIGIDVTARDIQQEAKNKSHPWSVAKGFDTFAPVSTFVAADKITDPQNLELSILVNGKVRQHGYTKHMIFSVATLISYLSNIFTLQPGDLIFTGTPEGVSPIKSGDQVKANLHDYTSLNVSVS
ncbi:MAG: fumarylacetoacetate hydrolase family protein [Balneolaceae bacterium]|nr:fumarylacetoacetate hydrolase family protein [Balneolaceae bacterium]